MMHWAGHWESWEWPPDWIIETLAGVILSGSAEDPGFRWMQMEFKRYHSASISIINLSKIIAGRIIVSSSLVARSKAHEQTNDDMKAQRKVIIYRISEQSLSSFQIRPTH